MKFSRLAVIIAAVHCAEGENVLPVCDQYGHWVRSVRPMEKKEKAQKYISSNCEAAVLGRVGRQASGRSSTNSRSAYH